MAELTMILVIFVAAMLVVCIPVLFYMLHTMGDDILDLMFKEKSTSIMEIDTMNREETTKSHTYATYIDIKFDNYNVMSDFLEKLYSCDLPGVTVHNKKLNVDYLDMFSKTAIPSNGSIYVTLKFDNDSSVEEFLNTTIVDSKGVWSFLNEELSEVEDDSYILEEKPGDLPIIINAKRELRRSGEDDIQFLEAYLDIVERFARMGHSGFSADYFIEVLYRLLKQKNLTALTNDPEEWVEFAKGELQSSRNSAVFSNDNLETVYHVDGDHVDFEKTYKPEE